MYGEAADAATPGFKARESGSVWPKPGPERPLFDTGMENPSLRDLPGFTSSYLGFVEGAPAPGPLSPDHPRKELLFSRCRAASRQIPLCAVASQTIREETPIFARSRRWSENVERLESSSAVVVGVSADTATFSTSLVPLLKCLTAIKLAGEISREGIPAVPLLWVDFPDWTAGSNTKNSDNAEANRAGIRESDNPLIKLTNDFNNTLEVLLNNELYRAKIDGILKWLIDEFGLVLVNPRTVGLRLIRKPDFEDQRRLASGLCEQAWKGPEAFDGAGSDSVVTGPEKERLSVALLLRFSLPVAAEVVAPDDLARTALLSHLAGRAGLVKPFLWPGISATIVDQRSRKIMDKFRLQLPDVLRGSAVLLLRLENDRGAAAVSGRLEALAGSIQVRIAELYTRASGDPRIARRIQASGSRMLYQLRKLAVRARLSADAHQDTMARQFEMLCNRIGPGGELQEQRLSATQLVSAHSESILAVLYRKIDVWDVRHQLIGLD